MNTIESANKKIEFITNYDKYCSFEYDDEKLEMKCKEKPVAVFVMVDAFKPDKYINPTGLCEEHLKQMQKQFKLANMSDYKTFTIGGWTNHLEQEIEQMQKELDKIKPDDNIYIKKVQGGIKPKKTKKKDIFDYTYNELIHCKNNTGNTHIWITSKGYDELACNMCQMKYSDFSSQINKLYEDEKIRKDKELK